MTTGRIARFPWLKFAKITSPQRMGVAQHCNISRRNKTLLTRFPEKNSRWQHGLPYVTNEKMKIYLSGGAVRDLLLGKNIADRDYLVMNTTRDNFIHTFPTAKEVGRTFPIFLIDKTEFSFPRASSINEELKSRDLTVNAQLLDEDGELICHPQSLDDLHNRILRPASRQSFVDDPLRVFRAARFWSKFPDFTPHDELIDVMQSIAAKGLLDSISPDRIGMETRKALNTPAPGNYIRLLARTGCLSPWFEEFKDSLNIQAGPLPYHDTNVIEHTCRVMDSLAGDEINVWMGLCHDIGKTLTLKDKLPHHHGHDTIGIAQAESLSRRIRLPNTHMVAGSKASKWHMTAARYMDLRPGTKVDLLMDVHLAGVLPSLFKLVQADQDANYLTRAERDLARILHVKLAKEEMNLGAQSGDRLRQLRAQVLANRQ